MKKKPMQDLKNSIDKFGVAEPIVLNKDGTIIGGHARFYTLRDNGVKEVPCFVSDELLSKDEIRELNVRLNKNIAGEWDWDALANYFDVGELTEWGFTEDELQFFEPEVQGLIDDDEIPEVEEAITKPGDLWILGEHRLLCGDATKKEDVERLMDGEKADMVFTSPPYNGGNFNLTQAKNKKQYAKNIYLDITIEEKTSDEYLLFNKNVFENIKTSVTETGNILYNLSYNQKSSGEYIRIINNAIDQNFKLHETIIWKKTSAVPLQYRLTRIWEHIFLLSLNKDDKPFSNQDLNETTYNYWEISNVNSQGKTNNACFPVELPQKGIEIFCKENGLVIDIFLGSGSTLIACEKTNRKCYGMEIDPHYCDVTVNRWQQFTGKKAYLQNQVKPR